MNKIKRNTLLSCVFALSVSVFAHAAPVSAPKVIIDSDYNTLSDDGQLGVMAAQLQADGKINVLGITVVSGNQWLKQGVADALKSVERLGVENQIGVYSGANYALSHDIKTIRKELELSGKGDGYLGAWSSPEPMTEKDLKAPPDGFATKAKLQSKDAVDFIVETVKKYPHEVSILAIGPLTNLAQAVHKNPEIVPLIKQIIYMGGAVDVPGNTTPTAEFNWWFDPEAAHIMVRQPIPQVIIPLDVTNTVVMDKKKYDRIVNDPAKQTIITKMFKQLNGHGYTGTGFEEDPKSTMNIWDTLTIAYLMDPKFATEVVTEFVDVDMNFGKNAGRSVGYRGAAPAGEKLQKVKVVKRFDNDRFFDFYTDLLTRPVPVKLSK
ncbi:nucleoside hydrolase [Paraherbaspirillum soli]|uniref:Nucleoside hydrolase n=1 Tax=Paraherbaspirillum soli TaxID=631222 RepID=A0ABW0M9R1_9BURK